MNLRNWLPSLFSNNKDSIIDYLPNYYIFWKDRNSVYQGCNNALAKYLGFDSPNDIIGKTDYDLPVKKEDCDNYIADDRYVIETKKPKLNIQESQTLNDGTTKTLLTSKVPLFDKGGEVCGVLGIYSDITEQKLKEQKLQFKSGIDKQLQESIIDHLPNHFIFWKDRHSVFLGCNKTFASGAHLTSPKEIIGKTDYDLPWSKEESDSYIADDQQVMSSGRPKLNIEETQTLLSGKKIVLSTSKVPLVDEQGDVYGVLAIYSDVTEQKFNELKLIEINKKLEKSNQVKSEFVRNISHDIRTPLAGIQQTMRAISDGKIPEAEIPEFAFAAWEASNKLMGLFNQIIEISKNEHFDFEDHIVKFDLHKLIDELGETYAIVAKHKKLNLEIEYSKDLPQYLIGKHLRLHRILMNLLGNALKFTQEGSVRLVVEQAQSLNEKILLRFSVIDTGIGIAPEQHDIIFEPFSRLTPSFQGQYPGSGLGLHVVKDYIEKMQGEIHVESSLGMGAMFTCVLPFKQSILNNDNDVVETTYSENIPAEEVFSLTHQHTHNKPIPKPEQYSLEHRVLLVEDDRLALKMGSLILRDLGYRVDVAQSGKDALEFTTATHYDLIYMDVGLPDIDGIETTRIIRANKNNHSHNTFIAALTAHADEDISKQCVEAGMQQILLKPLSPEKAQQMHELLIQDRDIHSQKATVDYELWRTRLGDNAYMLDQLFHLLAQDFMSTKQAIVQSYATHDLVTLKSVTHKMKGGLQYCGLPRLETAIKSIESAAKNNDLKEVNRWYQETLDALDEAIESYETWAKTN